MTLLKPCCRSTLPAAILATFAWALVQQPALAFRTVDDPEPEPTVEQPEASPSPAPASTPSASAETTGTPASSDGIQSANVVPCRQPIMPPRFVYYSYPGVGGSRVYNIGSYAVPADYDGDGISDPSRVFHSTGLWAIDYSSGRGFGEPDLVLEWEPGQPDKTLDSLKLLPVPADYDGDCKADRSFKDKQGYWRIDYAANGFGGWDVVLDGFGDERFHPVPADYDGDGKADLSTKDEAGNWYIDYAANGFGVGLPHLGHWDAMYSGFGGPEYIPVPADYDGDGKADFSTRDGDRWYVDRSSNGRGEEAWDEIYPGFGDPAVYWPMPADYDGDGKADFSSRDRDVWYIDWSSNGRGEEAWDAMYPGLADPKDYAPAPADYDGDGRADLASIITDTGIDAGMWLIDYAANGFGQWDRFSSWAPPTPTAFIVSTTVSSVTMGWRDNSSSAYLFEVQQAFGQNWGNSQYVWKSQGITLATFNGLRSNLDYCFRVRALGFGTASDYTPAVCGWTLPPPPPPRGGGGPIGGPGSGRPPVLEQ